MKPFYKDTEFWTLLGIAFLWMLAIISIGLT